ncbi:MAG: hypothetical protein Ct9H300mP23_06440 [Nitrospinota bacterium]|nr:MAG: hypothetical protein Ct9H300mP23_06440 [Nitrospinota bacterium]
MDIFISDTFSPGGGFTSWTSNEMPHATALFFTTDMATQIQIIKKILPKIRSVQFGI